MARDQKEYCRTHSKEAVERVRLWRIANRKRWLAQLRDHYARNRESERAKAKKYYDKFKHNIKWHRRRNRMNNGENCTAKISLLRLERFCRWCCERLTPATFTLDHIIPLSRGGKHIPDNLAACCRKCNFSRQDKLISEWFMKPSCYS